MPDPILVAQHGSIQCHLLPALANRQGLITGATGTGKTITLQTLAENFSMQGVPVFMADVKGDLTGISQRGTLSAKIASILKERGLPEPVLCPPVKSDGFSRRGLQQLTVAPQERIRAQRRHGRLPELTFIAGDDEPGATRNGGSHLQRFFKINQRQLQGRERVSLARRRHVRPIKQAAN